MRISVYITHLHIISHFNCQLIDEMCTMLKQYCNHYIIITKDHFRKMI